MPIIGAKRFPAVHGHAAQGTVATIAKGLVPLGLVDHVLHRSVEAIQMQLVQNIGHHIGAEGLHVRCGMTANELLEVFLLQIPSSALMLGMRSTAVLNKLLTTSKVGIFGARRVSTRLANKSGRPKTLQTYFSNCRSLLRESSIHAGNTKVEMRLATREDPVKKQNSGRESTMN